MALIKPFRALRPNPAYADQIADLPYDVMSSAEARVMVKDKPYSFLRIDRAEINFLNLSILTIRRCMQRPAASCGK